MKNLILFICFIILKIQPAYSQKEAIPLKMFNYDVKVENAEDDGTYLILNDGSKVHGQKIVDDVLRVDVIKIDKKKYKSEEVLAYRVGKDYYRRVEDSGYGLRIVKGKINVYVMLATSQGMSTNIYTNAYHFYQKGDEGELVQFETFTEMKKFVAGCEISVSMLNKKRSDLLRSVQEDKSYMNKIVEILNNDCKAL